jgi:RNA polymerase subunit RPABC4/transcription elongation factor Spt4
MVADSASPLVLLLVAGVAYVGAFWIALAFFVVRDAQRRSTSLIFLVFAGLLGFFPPFLGALIYRIIRPPHTLEEERSFALEEQALRDATSEEPPGRPCPSCGRENERDFVICPYCRTQFARQCGGCGRILRLGWALCPYCAEEVGVHALRRVRGSASS